MAMYTILFLYLVFLEGIQRKTSASSLQGSPVQVQTVISHSVRFDCPLECFEGFRWDHNEELLFVGKHSVNTKFQDSQNLLGNYSLYFGTTSLLHEGIYECKNETSTVASYLLEIIVPAKLQLAINAQNVSTNVTVPRNVEFTATCCAFGGKPMVNLSWVIDKTRVRPVLITFSKNHVKSEMRFIPSSEKGNITCISKSPSPLHDQYISAYYNTYELPKMSITANQTIPQRGTLYVALGDSVTLTCLVHGPIYSIRLFWAYDGETGISEESQGVKNFVASNHIVQKQRQDVSCAAISEDPPFEIRENLTLISYVVPSLSIYIDSRDVSNSSISLDENEDVVVHCVAYGSMPSVKLSFQTDDETMHNSTTIVKRNEQNSLTHDSHAYLVYRQTKSYGKAKCIAKGIIEYQQKYVILVTLMKGKKNVDLAAEEHRVSLLPILLVLTVLLVGGPVLTFVCNRRGISLRIRRGQDDVTYTHSLQNGLLTKTYDVVQKEMPHRAGEIFPVPVLPLKYRETDSGEYQAVEEYVEDYYCGMMDTSGGRIRTISQKDICFITCVKHGGTYNRWMGTLSTRDAPRKCVFITTLPENPSKQFMVNWDAYVKRILELPESPNITRLVGICTDKDSLLLLHEHLDGEPLAKSIDMNRNRTASCDVASVKGILSGMEFLHSFGFVHPGLSLKKILLTNDSICKLYDFRLPGDACRKVICMKEMTKCTPNELPPESLMRNEYDQDSDKWSIAVVTWQIFTNGCKPFSNGCSDWNKPKLPDDWPYQNEPGIIWTNMLYKFWSFTPFDRPSVRNVRLALEEMLQNRSRVSGTYEYTSMKEIQLQ